MNIWYQWGAVKCKLELCSDLNLSLFAEYFYSLFSFHELFCHNLQLFKRIALGRKLTDQFEQLLMRCYIFQQISTHIVAHSTKEYSPQSCLFGNVHHGWRGDIAMHCFIAYGLELSLFATVIRWDSKLCFLLVHWDGNLMTKMSGRRCFWKSLEGIFGNDGERSFQII